MTEEDKIARYPLKSFQYARDVLQGPFPKGEAAIATDGLFSMWYATQVLHGRFLKGEPAIIAGPVNHLADYIDGIDEPFPPGEHVVAKKADTAFAYAKHNLKGPFLEGEAVIITSPETALRYAKEVLKGPFPKGEHIISTFATSAYEYADFLNQKFTMGEDAIISNVETAFNYAKTVIRGPWPKGEYKINKSDKHKFAYELVNTLAKPLAKIDIDMSYFDIEFKIFKPPAYTKKLHLIPRKPMTSEQETILPRLIKIAIDSTRTSAYDDVYLGLPVSAHKVVDCEWRWTRSGSLYTDYIYLELTSEQ